MSERQDATVEGAQAPAQALGLDGGKIARLASGDWLVDGYRRL